MRTDTTTETKTRAPRMSADERREDILRAAVSEFAIKGLYGTSTEDIAARAGISQPYLFRLFRTKKDLFIAAVERGFDRVQRAFAEAAAEQPENPLEAMGRSYVALLPHREELLMQMQAYVACSDPDICRVVRARFAGLYHFVQRITDVPEEEVAVFFSKGMLLNVSAAIDLPAALDEADWLRRCLLGEPGD